MNLKIRRQVIATIAVSASTGFLAMDFRGKQEIAVQ